MDPSTENQFLEELVKRKFVKRKNLGSAFKDRGRIKDETGEELLLGQILLRNRTITTTQFLQASRAVGNEILNCPDCDTMFSAPADQIAHSRCACGQFLTPAVELEEEDLRKSLSDSSFCSTETMIFSSEDESPIFVGNKQPDFGQSFEPFRSNPAQLTPRNSPPSAVPFSAPQSKTPSPAMPFCSPVTQNPSMLPPQSIPGFQPPTHNPSFPVPSPISNPNVQMPSVGRPTAPLVQPPSGHFNISSFGPQGSGVARSMDANTPMPPGPLPPGPMMNSPASGVFQSPPFDVMRSPASGAFPRPPGIPGPDQQAVNPWNKGGTPASPFPTTPQLGRRPTPQSPFGPPPSANLGHQSPPTPFPSMHQSPAPFPAVNPNQFPMDQQRPSGAFPTIPYPQNAMPPSAPGPRPSSTNFPAVPDIDPPVPPFNSNMRPQSGPFSVPPLGNQRPSGAYLARPQGTYHQPMPDSQHPWQNPPSTAHGNMIPDAHTAGLTGGLGSNSPVLGTPMAFSVPHSNEMPIPLRPGSAELPASILENQQGITECQPLQAIPASPLNQGPLIPQDLEATEITEVASPAQGYAFGEYTIYEELGRGASGGVFKSNHPDLKIPIAIKILNDDLIQDKRAVRRFIREGKIMKEFSHKNIVKVYDYGEVNNRYYLVMDYIAGHSLDWHLQAGRLKTERALRILEMVCYGANHAHQKGIVHRDLKPDNIMLTEDDDPLLTDFGLAKGEELGLTKSGTAVGTPYFMSPEQIQGQKDVDNRADVYSMGVIAYRLLTGKLPFRAKSAYELYNKVLKSDPKAPTRMNKRLSGDFDVVILKAIKKDRNDRYQDMEEFGQDLGCLRTNKKPIHAGRKVSRRMRSWWKK
jgi:hypothetical protein